MTYNVGPDHRRAGTAGPVYCGGCDQHVIPEWDGSEGEWRCPACYEPHPDYEGDAE